VQLPPQSAGQVVAFSLASQVPSPQEELAQSPGQLAALSVPLQTPSPHTGLVVQSPGQVATVSVPLHRPSPQVPPEQSAGQVVEDSPVSHVLLGQ